ncbi:MAG: hypothetical protein QOF71_1904 [Candidatus Eremiobacteraeota bacterium]|nr:hypothetical protein [Candidatus Eremiobacteraeota bacterium]
MNHLDDDAELYALGLTDRERDAEIEAHLAACGACRTRVVAAESAAASLAAALPPMAAAAPRRAWWATVATAAAVVFAATAAFEGTTARTASTQLARTDAALGAIAASHFGHTTLTAESGVVAKALYARDGSWIYVVTENAPRGAHVVLREGAATRDLGALDAGTPATLFARAPGHAAEISVRAGDRIVARGTPAY